jgi:hypothetical protein
MDIMGRNEQKTNRELKMQKFKSPTPQNIPNTTLIMQLVASFPI